MMSEYIPHESEQNGHHNGNGKQKIFSLVPAQDGLTQVILSARRRVITNPDLTDGSKVLFVLLLDWSLWPGKNKGPGVITISTTKLRELLGRSARGIWGWKQELLKAGEIWITEHFLPNAYPMHTYHISAINPPEQGGGMATPDGLWGNGQFRRQSDRGTGARGSTQKRLKGILRSKKEHLSGDPESEKHQQNATGNRTEEHLSTAELATGNRKTCDGEPQNLLRATAKLATGNRRTCGGQPQETASARRTKQHPLGEAEVGDLSNSEVRGSTPPSEKAFEKWIKGLEKQYPRELDKLKTDLIGKIKLAKSPEAKAGWKRKLTAVEGALFGPEIPDRDPMPVVTRQERKPDRPLSAAEILEGAKYLVSVGKENLLTKAQREALR